MVFNKRSIYFALVLSVLFSSCALFKKTDRGEIPPPITEVEEEQPDREDTESEKDAGKEDEKRVHEGINVALFVPLDLDEVVGHGFEVGSRRSLPTETKKGLEFYEGALMAVDSLRNQQVPISMRVYDSKSRNSLSNTLKEEDFKSTDLIVGAVKGQEFKDLEAFSGKLKIPFLSATYPNAAGTVQNPSLIILNSTLKTHCVAIQDFAQKKFTKKNILLIYEGSPQGLHNLDYFKKAQEEMKYSGKDPLDYFEWKEEVTTKEDLESHLTKGKTNVILLTTLFPSLSLEIIDQLNSLKEDYSIKIIGMPTLEDIGELKQSKYKGIDFYYGAVFPYKSQTDYNVLNRLIWRYFEKYSARPDVDALSGFESLFYFGHLLNARRNTGDVARGGNAQGQIVTRFRFEPVYESEKASDTPDYFENTRIYFYRLRDGELSPAN